MDVVTYKSSSPAGDLLSILPGIRQIYRLTGKKAVIYQALDVVGVGVQGVSQPFKNQDGESIMMGIETFTMLRPLLMAQEYIEDFIQFSGQPIEYDLDEMRLKTFTNQPLGSLNRWPFYVFPEMACDLSEKWLDVDYVPVFEDISIDAAGKKYIPIEEFESGYAVVNMTSRYRNNWINYFFLKKYEKKIVFAGLPKEHSVFCKQWGLEVPILVLKDFYELAQILKSARFFLGNQSMAFQIAESLKIPRILEVCQLMPNVIPQGSGGYDFYHQQAVELYVHKLFNS